MLPPFFANLKKTLSFSSQNMMIQKLKESTKEEKNENEDDDDDDEVDLNNKFKLKNNKVVMLNKLAKFKWTSHIFNSPLTKKSNYGEHDEDNLCLKFKSDLNLTSFNNNNNYNKNSLVINTTNINNCNNTSNTSGDNIIKKKSKIYFKLRKNTTTSSNISATNFRDSSSRGKAKRKKVVSNECLNVISVDKNKLYKKNSLSIINFLKKKLFGLSKFKSHFKIYI